MPRAGNVHHITVISEKDWPVKVLAAGHERVLLKVAGRPVLPQDASS
jgi:hypothetical protein